MTNSKTCIRRKDTGCGCGVWVWDGYGGFHSSVGMGILWGFPRVFLWVWNDMGIEIQSTLQPLYVNSV